jgi:hypothetical protein
MGRKKTAKLQQRERTDYIVIIVVEDRVTEAVPPDTDGTPFSAQGHHQHSLTDSHQLKGHC